MREIMMKDNKSDAITLKSY